MLNLYKTRHAALAALTTLIWAGGSAQAASPTQPRLVVGIMVEDLRSDYLALLRDHFAQGGFNRLLNDGVVINNVDYGSPLDPAAATAVIYTGAAPMINGIPSEEVFDKATRRPTHIFQDGTAMGNYTSQTYSPAALQTTTIGDEVRIAGDGVTYVYSVAPDPAQAIIMAGHAGNCAVWINDAKMDWATTTYYRDVPTALNHRNRLSPLRARVDTMMWSPLYAPKAYSLLPTHKTNIPFRHVFRQDGNAKGEAFKQSPKANTEVTSFAVQHLSSLALGTHDGPDMLSLAYTAAPYQYGKTSDSRYELYDTYYRLDRELATLLSEIDRNVGLDNTLIFLAATPPSQRTRRDDDRWALPHGEFSTKKAVSLLNLYLIAIYGNGDWVIGYHNNEFFLNQKLIADRGIDIKAMRAEASNFLQRMSGVTVAHSLDDIIDGRSAQTSVLRQATVLDYAGDVRIQVMPGWQIVDDFNTPDTQTNQVVRATASVAPVIILAPNVSGRQIEGTVDARSIAPTITSLLRIRSPNAASEAPLYLEKY